MATCKNIHVRTNILKNCDDQQLTEILRKDDVLSSSPSATNYNLWGVVEEKYKSSRDSKAIPFL